MIRSDPARAQARLLDYVHGRAHVVEQTGPCLTMTELTTLLDVEPSTCHEALRLLARSGRIQVLIHPGARFELRPGAATVRAR